jgi:glucosamine--fructose-6-phosphate aminotransferase (isomerizing)
VQRTLEGRLGNNQVLVQAFGPQAAELFAKVRNVQIVACGTSYHAGMVARYWRRTGRHPVPGRSRQRIPLPQGGGAARHLFVTISQSGETADTLAALRNAKSWASSPAWRSATSASVRWCVSPT